jgi:hypothetical protein
VKVGGNASTHLLECGEALFARPADFAAIRGAVVFEPGHGRSE